MRDERLRDEIARDCVMSPNSVITGGYCELPFCFTFGEKERKFVYVKSLFLFL